MRKFESKEFLAAMDKHTNGRGVPSCSYCGGSKFTTTSKVAKIIIDENIDGISIGPIIPTGVLVCEGCGHIEFFALGTLGLLNNGKEASNGEQK